MAGWNLREEASVEAEQRRFGHIVKAVSAISRGELVFRLEGRIVASPTKYTIQIDEAQHVEANGRLWRLMNHSCDPNVRIDTERFEVIALRDIVAGEELGFDYNSTEWSLVSRFRCGCGSPACVGEVSGFKQLSEEQRERLSPLLSSFLRRRWRELRASNDGAEPLIASLAPDVHVLVPYETKADGTIASPQYDTPAFRAELPTWFDELKLNHVWVPVTLANVEEAVSALKALSRQRPILVLNLCDGTENDGMPGKTVVSELEKAGLPFTGASSGFYVNTTSKIQTKRLLIASGVATAPFVEIKDIRPDLEAAVAEIGFPLFIKPDVSAGSWGIHLDSVCYDLDSAIKAVERLRADPELGKGAVLAEPFIEGREFTCLVIEDEAEPLGLWALPPGERVFDQRVPANERFLAYERYWGLPEDSRPIPEGEPFYWYRLAPEDVRDSVADLARRAMRAVEGISYARVDIRYCERTGKLFVLEVNSQCGLSGSDDATVGSMLKLAGVSIRDVVRRIIMHASTRSVAASN